MRARSEPVSVERVDERPAPARDGTTASDGRQSLFMVVDGHEVSVAPGGHAAVSVRIRNTGSLVERVTLGVAELPPSWVSFDPADAKLDVAGEFVSTLAIRPPRSSEVRPGDTMFTISAWSATNPNVRCQEPCRLVIAEFAESGFVVDPPSSTGRGAATFVLSLANRGNQALRGRLEARSEAAIVELRPSTVDIAPGATGTIAVHVVPTARLITGVAVNHVVAVGLEAADTVAPASFTYRQQPRLSRLAARILGIVAVVLLLVAGLAIKSAWQNRARSVPAVSGLSVAEATQRLDAKGFKVVARDNPTTLQPKGFVYDQDPRPPAKAAKGARVTMLVSSGPPQQSVPNLMAKTEQDASDILTAQGLTPKVGEPVADAAVPAGSVSKQDPAPDTEVDAGATVTIQISSGPVLVAVPDLTALTQEAATLLLATLHLGLQVDDFKFNDQLVGRVVTQVQPPGSKVPQDTVIHVVVGVATGASLAGG
ncbi:MAG: PASTA domain-containing protein [Ilumatobacteraceae bacterium]